MIRGWTAGGVLAVAVSVVPSLARAELMNCPNLSANPADYKVVVDDFSFTSQAAQNDSSLSALNERLRFNFNGQVESLKASATRLNQDLRVPLRVVSCPGRKPSLEGTEFTGKLAERLTDERVVVEMWGTLDLKGNGPTSSREAMIGYVMPPVQRYVSAQDAPPKHSMRYPKSGQAAADAELENLPELTAFALVGLGTKAARANAYDLAVWAFTRAESSILDAQVSGTTPDLDRVLAYVKQASCATRTKARNDQAYIGTLKLTPAESCGAQP